MLRSSKLVGGLFAVGLAAAALPVAAQAPASQTYGPPLRSADCFQTRNWEDSTAVDDHTAYLTVGRDVYRLGLLGDAAEMERPGRHLVNRVRGVDRVCSARDLDLKVVDRGSGMVLPLFPVTLAKLSPSEVAALPANLRPPSAR